MTDSDSSKAQKKQLMCMRASKALPRPLLQKANRILRYQPTTSSSVNVVVVVGLGFLLTTVCLPAGTGTFQTDELRSHLLIIVLKFKFK